MRFLSKKDLVLPKREPGSHKGENGVVLAIGGSEQYPGAIALAAVAALRSGCDVVRVAAPEKVAWAVNCCSPDVITIKLKGASIKKSHYRKLKPFLESSDVLLLGNGMGISKEGKKFCRMVVNNQMLKVIDADALKMLSLKETSNAILTPHLRELEALLKNSGINKKLVRSMVNEKNVEKRATLVHAAVKNSIGNNIIIVKGRIDTILSKNKILYNKTGNPGMTRGGTGDVLAGLCAGFLAQSKDLGQSAMNATYMNGLIGDILLKKKRGYFFLASDMVEEIKSAKNLLHGGKTR